MNKLKKGILIVLIAIILNVAGRYAAFYFEWPMYLNLTGTILAAYVCGPVAGVASAILSAVLSLIFSANDWYFLVADVFVAIVAGLIVKKNRYFERFSLIYGATALFAIVRAIILLMINLSVNSGRSGLYIVDAIIDYLESISASLWLGYLLIALFISFTDVLLAMLFCYFVIRISKGFGKRRKAASLKKELMKKVAFGLAVMLVLASLLGNSYAYADNSISFIEKLYNSDNGLVGGCLNDVAMTRDGSMWIATYGGLFRFNGTKFTLIDNLSTVRSVQTLFVDEEDRLWAGTQDAGVTLLNIDMTSVTLDMNTGLPSNSVKCISRDSNGLYYFGTTEGLVLAQYDNGNVNILKLNKDAGNIRDLAPTPSGYMIVMDNRGKVVCYRDADPVATLNMGEMAANGIIVAPNGDIYIGTGSDVILVYEYSSVGFRLIKELKATGLKSIRDFYFDNSGVIYVAADNGIGYFDSSRHFSLIETGIFNNSIEHIMKDYQGNLWFTSSRCGLLCLVKSSFIDVFKLCNEKTTVCNAVKEWNGYLYVATNTGLKILDVSEGKSIKNEVTKSLDAVRIRSLDTDRSGNLLIATYEKGLLELDVNGGLKEYIDPEETEKKIRVVHTLSDGTIITSSDAGIVFLKDHEVLGKLRLGEELSGGTVLNIFETTDGTLLCGTDADGIAVIKNMKPERYITRENGLPSGVILRIVNDENGNGYFVLTGSGLCYMDKSFGIKEITMPYYNNFDIAVNSSSELFILGGAGIYICGYKNLMQEGKMETYTLLDTKAGLPGGITSNAWNYVTEDEHLYICGTSGMYMLDLNNYEMTIDEFKTKITAIIRDGVYEDVTQVGTIFIPKDTDRIELNLEINNYTTADPYVTYYMSGVDSEKITVLSSKLGGVTYYDIPYGNHEFVISVVDDKGRELSKQTYVFSKERELFETVGFTLYFYLTLFTFIVFIVISIVQGALWTQRKRETGRHELVVSQLEREKTEALERALHMEADASRTKAEFLANMTHEVKTPINAIIGMDTMILRESNEENIKAYARDIDIAGRKLITLINNIHEFSRSGNMENRLEEEEEKGVSEVREEETVADRPEIYHAPDAKILVIDDVEMELAVAKNLLKRIKVQVDTAVNGEEAVNLASEKSYDIIFIDSAMPGMDDENTMRAIRKQCPDNAETPIIVLTSHAISGAREEYLSLGYTNYLAKPLDGSKLEAMIQSYLPDEKIIFIDEEENHTDDEAAIKEKLALISKIEGIDAERGAETAGGEDVYVLLCRNFRDMALKRIELIKESFEKVDFLQYTSLLHDLENAARLIGAFELSEKAEELENAGREENNVKIGSITGDVLKEYRRFHDRLDEIFVNADK